MDIVKAFNSNNLHSEIIIKGTYNDPLFRASDIGNVLDISTIRSVIRDFNETEKVVHSMHTPGGVQDVTFLTEKGLYKVLFRSRKPIAETFQNWVCEVIKEIRLKGVYDLQKAIKEKNNEILELEDKKEKELQDKLTKQKVLEREKILLKEYATIGSIFYIIKIKTLENGQYIVKIGESRRGIKDRYMEHKSKYDECLLLDCFTVNKSKDFETYIKEHELIRPNKVCDLDGHESEMELFLIGKNLTYSALINIINNNIKYFNDNNTAKLELEIEQLKMLVELKNKNNDNENLLVHELIKTVNSLSNKIHSLEKSNQEILNKLNTQQTKVTTGYNQQLPTLGPRLQKINPENLQLIRVYESVTELMNEDKHIKRPSIMKSIQENTIYCGFRWQLVERNLNPNIIHFLEPTKDTKTQNLGYIAKLDANKTEILNVYLDRKTAAIQNNFPTHASLDNPVKNGTISNGHFYILYETCDEELKSLFEEKNGVPILYKNGVGQFDSNGSLLNEFICKYDCIRTLKISDKTLTKALDKNIAYNNTYFKTLGTKLQYL